ncbi:MAG: hydrogenase maturation protease [Anaerolineae bacterium]|nr:hydrogenase maturation protease [Anaerolineae bacterium]MDW8099902.1 hydrogenase maturation protease [Anaerolineae bacterium]
MGLMARGWMCCDGINQAQVEGMGEARRILVLGYGNLNRQDDGIGFHVINELARRWGRQPFEPQDDGLSRLGGSVDLAFVPQLVPELAEVLADYDEVYFVDAHTGAYEEPIRWETLKRAYAPSAFTHHMTPVTLLEITAALYGRAPMGRLISVRGYRFGFGVELSLEAQKLCEEVAEQIIQCVSSGC